MVGRATDREAAGESSDVVAAAFSPWAKASSKAEPARPRLGATAAAAAGPRPTEKAEADPARRAGRRASSGRILRWGDMAAAERGALFGRGLGCGCEGVCSGARR